MVSFLIESVVTVAAAALLGVVAGFLLGRLASRPAVDPGLADDLRDLGEARYSQTVLEEDAKRLRSELTMRYADIALLTEERDDARAAHGRAVAIAAELSKNITSATEDPAEGSQDTTEVHENTEELPPVPADEDDVAIASTTTSTPEHHSVR